MNVPEYQRERVTQKNARAPAVIKRAQALISNDPEQSLQKLASIFDVSEPIIRRIVEENLRYKSYTLKMFSVRLPGQAELYAVICYCVL